MLVSAWAVSAAAQSLVADRATATYSVDESMNFILSSNASGTATYTVKYDTDWQATVLASGTVNVTAGQDTMIPFTGTEPGFVLCEVQINGGATLRAAANFGALSIAPHESEPADFDAFWSDQLAAFYDPPGLAMNVQTGSVTQSDYSRSWSFNLQNVDGRRVYGYVTVPEGEGPFPAILNLPAYGSSQVGPSQNFAEESGAIVVSISIHNGNPDPNAYEPNDTTSRQTLYYRWAILGAVRTIDYIETLTDFDGENLGVMGLSQGGGLSFIVAGLDSRVDAMAASAAALAEHTGLVYGKASGFPDYIRGARDQSLDEAAVKTATKYYDAVHFAKRFKGPAFHHIPYQDTVCPPATHFAAYNQTRGEKILLHSRDLGHTHPWAEHQNARAYFFRRHFGMPSAYPWRSFEIGFHVDAGADQQLGSGSVAQLAAVVEDEDTVNTTWPGSWSVVSGPGSVNFAQPNSRSTSASFSSDGTYVLRFLAQEESLLANQAMFRTFEDTVTIEVGTGGGGTCAPSGSPLFFDCFESGTASLWSGTSGP